LFFRPGIGPTVVAPVSTTTAGQGLPQAQPGTPQIIADTPSGAFPAGPAPVEDQVSPVANGGLTQTSQITDTASLGTTLSQNGLDINFYNRDDGKFYRIDKDGNASLLADKVFYNVEDVTWAPQKNKAILEYPDGANILYNFDTGTQVTLPSHWKDFDFSPSGDQIISKSIGLDPSNRWLIVSEADGAKIKPIEPLGTKDATVYPDWSNNNQMVAMYTEGVDFDRQEVFFLGLNNENFKSTVVEGRGFEPMWSPQGDKLLYSVYSSLTDMKPNLWVVNAQGDDIGTNRKNLNIQTWADKCTYTSDTEIYCAVPTYLEEGAGIFPDLAYGTPDRLYQINTVTGTKKLVAIPDQNYTMENLMVTANGYYLYFTDQSTGQLHKIKLK
jgi:Tol biopolymer transport system component